MDFIDEMWEKYCLYSDSEKIDEYTKAIIKALFFTLYLLIADEGSCSTECEYWCRFMQLTREYSFLPEVEVKFDELISSRHNEQLMKHYNKFIKIKQGYGIFFTKLYISTRFLIIEEYGLPYYNEILNNNCLPL